MKFNFAHINRPFFHSSQWIWWLWWIHKVNIDWIELHFHIPHHAINIEMDSNKAWSSWNNTDIIGYSGQRLTGQIKVKSQISSTEHRTNYEKKIKLNKFPSFLDDRNMSNVRTEFLLGVPIILVVENQKWRMKLEIMLPLCPLLSTLQAALLL